MKTKDENYQSMLQLLMAIAFDGRNDLATIQKSVKQFLSTLEPAEVSEAASIPRTF